MTDPFVSQAEKTVEGSAPQIYKKLAKIQQELKAPKGQYNDFGRYNYRSCEDIVEAVKPLLGEAVLLLEDEIVLIGNRYYVKATAELRKGVESVKATAFARESEVKKGMDESQITGAASSYARKYALNGLFAIDDTKDADTRKPDDFEPAVKPRKKFVPSQVKSIDYVYQINSAKNMYALSKIGLELKTANIPPEQLENLRKLYKEKEQSFKPISNPALKTHEQMAKEVFGLTDKDLEDTPFE